MVSGKRARQKDPQDSRNSVSTRAHTYLHGARETRTLHIRYGFVFRVGTLRFNYHRGSCSYIYACAVQYTSCLLRRTLHDKINLFF